MALNFKNDLGIFLLVEKIKEEVLIWMQLYCNISEILVSIIKLTLKKQKKIIFREIIDIYIYELYDCLTR